MKKNYTLKTLLILSILYILASCGSSDDPAEYTEVSPVVMDLTTVPYQKLSDYKFFTGELKNLEPTLNVLPYDLNSALFTDYAQKKRFVWMPKGSQATYGTDGTVLNFPTGSALIKNFYYENVMPGNTTKIIETRIMIKKADGWIFANYVWNNEQTEAFLDLNGSSQAVKWMQDGKEMSINYTIPNGDNCAKCHNKSGSFTPIGTKPQNLYKDFTYADGVKNQLLKWKEAGMLNSYSQNIVATVDWKDESKSLDLRARSYMDINCAHCHSPGGDCDDMPLDFSFTQTVNPVAFGICQEPHDFVSGNQRYVIESQDGKNSLIYFRMQTTIKAEMMPPIGRSTEDTKALMLIREWIDTMETPCE